MNFKNNLKMYTGTNIGLCEGDKVELTHSYSVHGKNAYIGFTGIVKIDNLKEGKFSLFSGKSWLTNLSINDDRFKIIKKNKNGMFEIKNVHYYNIESVIHKPKKCCKCGFIPVDYIRAGFFNNKFFCSNCKK